MDKKISLNFNAENVAVPDVEVYEDGIDAAKVEVQEPVKKAESGEKVSKKLKVAFEVAVPEVDVEED